MRYSKMLAIAAAAAMGHQALATVITFDDGAVLAGATLSNQYAASGVTFAPGGGAITGVINPIATTQGFATNTTMLIGTLPTSSGAGAPLAGLTLRTSSGWLNEDGDPVFTMTFSSPISTLSMDFGANSSTQPAIFAVDPVTGIAYTAASSLSATSNGTLTAALLGAVSTVVVVPGSYFDFVTVDNINFTSVPEPTTLGLAAVGGLGLMARRRKMV